MNIAIYGRKSVFRERGDSVENQLEICKEFCKRNFMDEHINYLIFEDDGWSAKDTNRPEFQRMMKLIKEKKIDKLVCYKLDRISRSVSDFSTIYNQLEESKCDFISVVEQFDTRSVIGKAMLQICSVFAEMERNTIAERVKDSMLQMAKRGQFLGGPPVLGFSIKKAKYINENMKEKEMSLLVPNLEELELIKHIYKTYLASDSASSLAKKLSDSNIRNRNNLYFTTSLLIDILRNPIYVKSSSKVSEYLKNKGINVYGAANGNGYLTYNKTDNKNRKKDNKEWICAITKHKGIIDSNTWLEVQKKLDNNKEKQIKKLGTGENPTLLAGLLKCSKCNSNMLPRIAAGKYYYYICSKKLGRVKKECDCKNVRADQVDKKVLESIKIYSKDIFLNSLTTYLSNNSDTKDSNYIKENLNKQISEKEKIMNGLVNKIALSTNEDITNIFMSKIEEITNEIKELKLKLCDEEIIQNENENNLLDIKAFIHQLKNFESNINSSENIIVKRRLLNQIVNKIIWDSDNYEISIEYAIDIENVNKKK